ncbi:MAG: S8 family serine peptidase [Methylotenera sp.]|nr:S8 family serine peptidase [Oligoflexia bacterium]
MKYSFLILMALSIENAASASEYLLVPATAASAAVAVRAKVVKLPQITASRPVFSDGEKAGLAALGKPALGETWVLDIPSSSEASEVATWLRKNGAAFTLEENYRLIQSSTGAEPLEKEQWALHNDGSPQKVDLDYITTAQVPGVAGEDIQLPKVAPEFTKQIMVAVLDTGVDINHPDLQNQISYNPEECQALDAYKGCVATAIAPLKACDERSKKDSSVKCDKESGTARPLVKACDAKWAKTDRDGNGYPLDCAGWNVMGQVDPAIGILGNNEMSDPEGHGTHVAGIIAAAVNGVGIRGMAPQVSILPVRVIADKLAGPVRPMEITPQSTDPVNPDPTEISLKKNGADLSFTNIVARGMLYAIRSRSDVISISLGWPSRADSRLIREMLDLAARQNILVVASAGNDSTDTLVFPCQHPGVICVGAHGPDGKTSHFSNFGSGVDISAPGLRILSTVPTSLEPEVFNDRIGYDFKSGTSMSTPFVSGALAYLLSTGMTPSEARARLLAGARPQPVGDSKKVVFGNLDIQRSLNVAPKSLILAVEKGVTPLLWDRHAGTIKVPVQLKNIWMSGSEFSISAKVSARGATSARVSSAEQNITNWAHDEVKSFEVTVDVLDPKLPSDLEIEMTVSQSGGDTRLITVPLQISVPVRKSFQDDESLSLQISGQAISPQANLRSVTALDGVPTQDYIAIEKKSPKWTIQLITPVMQNGKPSGYVGSKPKEIDPVVGELQKIQRLDVNQDSKSDYVLIYLTREGRLPGIRFDVLDSNLEKMSSTTYPNDTTPLMLGRFQWLKVGTQLVPAWVGRGNTPVLEKAKYNPWKPNAKDLTLIRFYYLAKDGLRTLKAPEGYNFVDILDPTRDQRKQGLVPVLLAQNDDFETTFATVEMSSSQSNPVTIVPFKNYRNLRGLDADTVINLDPGSPSAGTAFTGTGALGTQRTTALLFKSGKQTSLEVHEVTQKPLQKTASVGHVSGTFQGQNGLASFALGLYDLQFHEENSSRTLTTSLRKCSFLPSQFSQQFFYPIVVGNESGALGSAQQRLPGIIIPDGFGAFPGTEVIVPTYDSQGVPETLLRPARLRFQTGRECEALGNTLSADRSSPSAIMFYCGDRFIKMPIMF